MEISNLFARLAISKSVRQRVQFTEQYAGRVQHHLNDVNSVKEDSI